jgi:hypothetical protein
MSMSRRHAQRSPPIPLTSVHSCTALDQQLHDVPMSISGRCEKWSTAIGFWSPRLHHYRSTIVRSSDVQILRLRTAESGHRVLRSPQPHRAVVRHLQPPDVHIVKPRTKESALCHYGSPQPHRAAVRPLQPRVPPRMMQLPEGYDRSYPSCARPHGVQVRTPYYLDVPFLTLCVRRPIRCCPGRSNYSVLCPFGLLLITCLA